MRARSLLTLCLLCAAPAGAARKPLSKQKPTPAPLTPSAPSVAPRAVARLVLSKLPPRAKVSILDKAHQARPGKSGQLVMLGETVDCGPGARAILRLAGGTEVTLGSHTRVRLDQAPPETRVHVLRGKALVRTSAKRAPGTSVEAATANSHAVSEGTLFSVCYDDKAKETFVAAEKGRTSVFSAGGSFLSVAPGDKARVVKRRVPEPATAQQAPAPCGRY